MSSVGHVTEETVHVRGIAEAAIAEAKSVHEAIESKVASLTAQADASIAHITGVLSERVQQVAEYSDAQASRVAGEILQQLEKGLEAVATSAAATSERQTRTAESDPGTNSSNSCGSGEAERRDTGCCRENCT